MKRKIITGLMCISLMAVVSACGGQDNKSAGVIGALTIQRTIDRGFLYGFITGLGSTAADMIYKGSGL